MDGLVKVLLVYLYSISLAWAPPMEETVICVNCVEYHPTHWKEDNFPAIQLIKGTE